jgi:hypothetical protein
MRALSADDAAGRCVMYALRYTPGTKLGKDFPLWRFGFRRTRESAEATRVQCANADQIEVVEVDA